MQIRESLKIQDSLKISTRTYFSIQHIQSAANFTRLALNIENNFNDTTKHELYYEHQSYVTGAIFTSVAFLEATINELFADCSDVDHGNIKEMEPKAKELLGNMWNLKVPRSAYYSILDKYQIALTLASEDNFSKGTRPYQDIDTLIKLRNYLIHYEPESIVTHSDNPDEITEHKFEKGLRGKFSLNPLMGAGNAVFPKRCLSYGCSKWAVENSIAFTDDFFNRLKLNPTYDHIRNKLVIE